MKRNLLRTLLKGFSLTSAMFIFQACYGTPQDLGLDLKVEGQVLSKSSRLPIKNISVKAVDAGQQTWTDSDGKFMMYTERNLAVTLSFEDTDLEANGRFIKKDTTLTDPPEVVSLKILLEEQQ